MGVVLLVAVAREKRRRGRARRKLRGKDKHLAAVAEALIQKIEGAVELPAHFARQSGNLFHLCSVGALQSCEGGLTCKRLLFCAQPLQVAQHVQHHSLVAYLGVAGAVPQRVPAQGGQAPRSVLAHSLGHAFTRKQGGLGVAQRIAQLQHGAFVFHRRRARHRQRVEDKPNQGDALVEGGRTRTLLHLLACPAFQDAPHLVVAAILVEERVIGGKRVGHLVVAQKLGEQVAVERLVHALVDGDGLGEVFPAARRDEALAAAGTALHLVEAVGLGLEKGGDGRVQPLFLGVVLPCRVIRLDVDLAQAVERDDVELVHRFVVLGRVARAHNRPVLGHAMPAERLELQELEHGGVQGLGHAINLVKEEYAAAQPGLFHVVVDGSHNLRHRVLGGLVGHTLELAVLDARQAKRALPRVMRHRVAHDANGKLLGHLLHHGGLADAGCAHKKDGALARRSDAVHPRLVFFQVRLDRVRDLALRSCDVHAETPFFRICMPLS